MINLQLLRKRSIAPHRLAVTMLAIGCAVAGLSFVVSSAGAAPGGSAMADAAPSADMVSLPGHVTPRAQARFDVGEAPDSLPLKGLEIVFARTAAQQRDLQQLIAAQQDPKSPEYHHWLTPAEFGARFGASDTAVASVTRWLQSNGFTVDALPANRGQLRFHGSKAQVETAFRTQIHAFDVNGEKHFAVISNPQLPAALAPLIVAIHGLNDFYPKSSVRSRPRAALVKPQVTYNGKNEFIGPGDFAVMYNLTPLYKSNGNGNGVTIAIAGESDIDPSVASTYWAGFGLSTPTFNSMAVPGGQDPGQTNDPNETEAYLDVEIAGSLAQGASILLVRDKNVGLAVQYVIQNNLAPILNISFSNCESDLGSDNQALYQLFQQAVAQGMTVTVSSGDAGAAMCESNVGVQGDLATTGYAVNGFASTPYTLSVGGTDFNPTEAQDWSSSNAPGTLVTAQAHIPEMVWNDTCADPLIAQVLKTTTSTLCNTATLSGQPNSFLQVAGGAGGLSSCLSLSNGACQGGYAQPSWQKGTAGTENFDTRAVPDVSMIATSWIICSYDDSPCSPANGQVDIAGGTSAAAPAVAAIVAILDQGMATQSSPDGRQGLLNPQLYKLAALEYGTAQAPSSTAAACSATLGASIGAGCVFYNVTAGTNAMPCKVSTYNAAGTLPASTCAAASGQANGIMSIGSAGPQYQAGTGFTLAAGLGSLNAGNLVLALYLPPPTGLAARATGQSVNLTWTAEPHASLYNVYQSTQSGQEGAVPVQNGLSSPAATVSGLQYGTTYYFTVAAQSAIGTSAQSSEVKATIVPAAPTGLTASAGNGSVALNWNPSSGASSYTIYQSTAGAAPTAAVSGITGTMDSITGLANGTTYFYTVAAIDAGGASAMSNQTQATPTAPSGGGGGALGWLETSLLGLLAMARGMRRRGARPASG